MYLIRGALTFMILGIFLIIRGSDVFLSARVLGGLKPLRYSTSATVEVQEKGVLRFLRI